MKMEPGELHFNLRQFSGGDTWYCHAIAHKVWYSEGMKYLAENGGAWWLIDAIASHLAANPELIAHRKQNERFDGLHFWKLRKTEGTAAVLEAVEDTGYTPVVSQEIEFTDFPFPADGEFLIYAGCDIPPGVTKLFLPSEY